MTVIMFLQEAFLRPTLEGSGTHSLRSHGLMHDFNQAVMWTSIVACRQGGYTWLKVKRVTAAFIHAQKLPTSYRNKWLYN